MADTKHKSRSNLIASLDRAATDILPVCTNNICTVREQIETAINGLLKNFTQLAQLIDRSATETKKSGNPSLARLALGHDDISQSATQLHDILALLYPILIETRNDKALSLVSQAFLRTVDIRQTSESCQPLVAAIQQEISPPSITKDEDAQQAMQRLLNEMIVALQFQDRISQILGGVEKTLIDLAGLTSIISAGRDERIEIDIDVEQVLRDMRSRYVTPEQKANDSSFRDAPTKTAGSGGDITFF